MTSRLASFLVALLMLWTGLASVPAQAAWATEAPAAMGTLAAAQGEAEATAPDGPATASCAEPLAYVPPVVLPGIDLPAESPTDPPALPVRAARGFDAGFGMAPPRADALPLPPSPDLAGPQRPPCRRSSIA